MRPEDIDHILNAVKAPLNHPLFYPRVFALASKSLRFSRSKSANKLYQTVAEEYEELSRRLDRSQIQESCSVRNILRSRHLATLLIDEKGELNADILPALIEQLKAHLHSLGPYRQYDSKRQEHILKVLQLLATNKEAVRLLKKISRPLSNRLAEEVIKHTLQLPLNTVLTDAHAKRAVLSAWLCYLRQNVGSCFATAPAEVVHDEQPELFLQDMSDLLATGRLKRTFGGIEYSVPISASWGSGDLKKPLLIQLSTKGMAPEIWYSPGLMVAFEAAGLFEKEQGIKERTKQIKEWIEPLIIHHANRSIYSIITAEDILKWVLLQVMGLSEQQIKEYENRPRGMVQSSLLMQMPPNGKSQGGIGERCANFLYQFEAAKNAFKALADNALLKTWEFTLASFSETKLEFTTWNLYASLGMGTSEPGGIGQCIQHNIQNKLDEVNRKVQDIQYEYEMVYTQVKTLESRMRHASTEKEVQWLKIEYQSRTNEFYFLEEQRDAAQGQAAALVNLYDTLYKLYLELFKDYFQEVYDADMQEVTTGPFDDSPAGFRLLYKHGRSNTSQWTRIKNQNDFIDALASFFVATEPQIASSLEGRGIEKDLADVVTAIINHVKTKEFLETAFYRMAAAHHVPLVKDPLQHLDQVEKKPWVYTSGGTMNTLVSCYYRIEDKPKEAAKWVENETELLVFLADTLKHISPNLMEPFLKGNRSAMLMQSPTHAFLLKPMQNPFRETWTNDEFTYTFVRDHFIKPAEMFVERILLNDDMLYFLVQELLEKVPENFQPRFKEAFGSISSPLNPIFFRQHLVNTMEEDRGLRFGRRPILATEEIDSLLYSRLPLFPIHELKDRLRKIFILLPGLNTERIDSILDLFERIPLSRSTRCISANQLQDICKALLCLSEFNTTVVYNYHLQISLAAQKLGFAMPTPVIFADTNWVKDEFGFVVNPGTGQLELWRLDYTGSLGYPMTSWKEWVNGSRPDLKWGIYIKPPEYGQV
ncbi:hypothetical protein [Candidatus Protochlamydia phocaeensis]|uniref:hypothetical protein n=1 Tax=Candidatus Protochlamydia phocaeensis TaxID=1414722 RepID=UPI000839AAFB|nr:hypothetical protein [Candidatus Protochlamydia phocaeensis]